MKNHVDVSSLLPEGSGPRLLFLAQISIGRVLSRFPDPGHELQRFGEDKTAHIIDWLSGADIRDAAWLRETDERGRPKKLMKCGTLERLHQEADKAMLQAASRGEHRGQDAQGDVSLYAELRDGYCLVRLLTPEALDRESALMQHCVGNGAYDKRLADPDTLFLSLRDHRGKPHLTMEVHNGKVLQAQGKQNATPLPRYREVIRPLLTETGWDFNGIASRIGAMRDRGGEVHLIENLPEGLSVGKSLSLDGCTGLTSLPEGLTIGGSLFLDSCTGLTSLPGGAHRRWGSFSRRLHRPDLPPRWPHRRRMA